MDHIRKFWQTVLALALLSAVTLVAFWPVLRNDFIGWDDNEYVKSNPHVIRGLTWDGAAWALRTGHSSNWHPLTWLSHMLDVQLFSLNAGGHHLNSLLLHTANAALLLLLLNRMTGALWRSALVAALFALHPLHVESVAWVAERKDVLSTFFFMLTVMAYAGYLSRVEGRGSGEETENRNPRPEGSPKSETRRQEPEVKAGLTSEDHAKYRGTHHPTLDTRHSSLCYFASLLCFCLGLMSKAMLVTVPFVLLLLDYWPLRRVTADQTPNSDVPSSRLDVGSSRFGVEGSRVLRLVFEKLPFFALAAASSVVTLLAQGKAHAVAVRLPVSAHVANALAAYVQYLGKAVWPAHLAIFYPHPVLCYPVSRQWPAWQSTAAAALLAGISVWAWLRLKRRPWFATGWFWFLGTLVPVIGIVQVGSQAMADRYTYIPFIGLFICVVWGAAEGCAGRHFGRGVVVVAGLTAVAACAAATRQQVKHWRNGLTVFEHALEMTTDNVLAHCQVGTELGERGKYDLAETHFRRALAVDPNYADAHYGLGVTFQLQGKAQEALEQYQAALGIKPWYGLAHSRLGTLLWSLGRQDEALEHYAQAVSLQPDDAEAHYNLGTALTERGELAEASAQFAAVVQLDRDYGDTLARLAALLFRQGNLAEAEVRFRQLAGLKPADAAARINLGGVLWRLGRFEEALAEYAEAVRFNPEHAVARYNLGFALSAQGRRTEAAKEFEAAVRLKPDYAEALSSLAWLLATTREAGLRNGAEAVRLAERACELSGGREARFVGTLDAAYAEAGRFGDAIRTAEKARALALAAGQTNVAQAAATRLALYREQKPFHE